jgi:hypothetical protein
MCFGRRSGSAEACAKTHCNVIAVRLLTIGVLQPIVSPLSSVSCRLITPYIPPFWCKNDGTVVTFAGTACNASCAATVMQFFYARSGLVFRQSRGIVRELHKVVRRYARVVRTAVVRLGNECSRVPIERSGTMLCADLPALTCTAVANGCYLRAGSVEPCGRRYEIIGKVKQRQLVPVHWPDCL